MSHEFFSRWKLHQKLGILVLAGIQAFFSYLLLGFDMSLIKGIVLLVCFAIYMTLIVILKLYDLYSRKSYELMGTQAVTAIALGLAAMLAMYIFEGAGSVTFVIVECLLTIVIYALWMLIMRLWFKRHFCPHEYVCVGDGDSDASELMKLEKLDGAVFSKGTYFKAADDKDISGYMEMFRVGIMVISKVNRDTCSNMLSICRRFNAMAFLAEKPELLEYESNIREVYIGGRKLWLYLPQN